MDISLLPLSAQHDARFQEHIKRHKTESGENGFHYMPFAPGDSDGPRNVDFSRLKKPQTEPGWQRSFVTVNHLGHIVGHVHLKGDMLKTLSHRCWLELGVDKDYRRQGLATRLCETAISFARDTFNLDWIDLYTFAHNAPARALYTKFGFKELGITVDRFRIDGLSIDDVLMTLPLRENTQA